MPRASNCVSLLIISMILNSLTLWSRVRRMTKPIHIRLTSEYLVVYANLGQVRKGSFMHFSWVLASGSFLRFWNAQKPRHKKLLIVCLNDTPAGNGLRKTIFREMRAVGTSLGWTV